MSSRSVTEMVVVKGVVMSQEGGEAGLSLSLCKAVAGVHSVMRLSFAGGARGDPGRMNRRQHHLVETSDATTMISD